MERSELESLTRIGRSLWGDWDRSYKMSEETLSHVAMMNLNDTQALERASKVMIERAEKNPPPRVILNHPFFRMAPVERFLLSALHVEKWSYARIARTLGIDSNSIAPWAWATRLKFAYEELELDLAYPRSPAQLGPHCPEYSATAPWTQKMLDDEMGRPERFFMQNHLMGCDRCRKSLEQTQKLIFKIESAIPSQETAPSQYRSKLDQILKNWNSGQRALRPTEADVAESFRLFLGQPKVVFGLATLVFLVLVFLSRI